MDTATEPLAYSVPQVLAKINIGRDKLYALIREGKLPARKCGKRTLVTDSDLETFLQALPRLPHQAA